MTERFLPTKQLGQTGMAVSRLGLGTVKFGRNTGVKYPTGFTLPDDAAVRNILQLARQKGINLLDTAPAYGNSEERLGALLTDRQDWILCTKVGEEYSNAQSSFDFSARHVRHSIVRSLQRLRTDYLDIVLVHSDGNDVAIIDETDCLAELLRCKEEGLIRAFGMSTKTVAGGLRAVQECDVVMVTCNSEETADIVVIEQAELLRKGVLIKKALNSGHALLQSAGNTTADPLQRSMQFVFSQTGVTAVIIGSINPQHLRHNIKAVTAACVAEQG